MVSEYDKEKKLEKRRANYKKQLSEESAEKKQERLAKMRASYNKRCSEVHNNISNNNPYYKDIIINNDL